MSGPFGPPQCPSGRMFGCGHEFIGQPRGPLSPLDPRIVGSGPGGPIYMFALTPGGPRYLSPCEAEARGAMKPLR
jgi:hypothetical protein